MKKIIFYITFFLTFEIFATGGSIYTRYGLGDLTFGNSARKHALGSIGTSILNQNFINPYNPASLTSLKETRFESGLSFSSISMKDDKFEDRQTNFNFSGISLVIPLERDLGFVMSLGILPVTNVDYYVSSSINNPDTNLVNSKLSTILSGKGGLSKYFLGFSYKLYDFSIGASFDYYTGKNEYISTLDFSNNFDYLDVSFTKRQSFSGIGGTFGLVSPDLTKIINVGSRITNWRLGLAFSIASKIDLDSVLVKKTTIGELESLKGSSNFTLPISFSIGTNFTLDKEYLISVDYFYQAWSDYKIKNKRDFNLTDLNKITLALEYQNSAKRISSNFWQLVDFRGGLNFEQTQYLIQNNNINAYSVFAGMSLPLGVGNTIDISLEYGIRGKNSENLVKENFINSIISISLGELWFMRPEK